MAQWLRMHFQSLPGGEFSRWLEVTVGSLTLDKNALEFIASTKLPILTTNYDGLLEECSGRDSLSWRDQAKIARFHDRPEQYIFHLHGHWDDADSVILSGDDYQKLASAPEVSRVFQQIVATYTPVFVGYGNGLTDPNFSAFVKWFTENFDATARRMYVLCRNANAPHQLVGRDNLYYIPYGETHGHLPSFLESLLAPEGQGGVGGQEDVRVDTSASQADHREQPLAELPPSLKDETARQLGSVESWEKFQSDVLYAERSVITTRGAALISAVTGTGKTTLSRAAMNLAVARGYSAVMIVPTKALVAQEVREWDRWIAAWLGEDRQVRVYPASRDYPESDAPVSRGRFDVAVAIYEKIAGYLAAGQPTLSKTAILVVDELQTLVADKDRATKLESLLTMVRLLPPDSRPAIVGLSATLSSESTDVLRRWLDVPDHHFLQSVSRSVPLDAYVVDSARMRKQSDAHLFGLGNSDVVPPPWEDVEHSLLPPSGGPNITVKGLSTASLAVALVTKLLVDDPERRLIVFVPGRTAAEDMALAIQRSLDGRLGVPPRKLSPWIGGRFAVPNTDPEHAKRLFDELKDSDLPMVDNVIRGMRHGVAYHTARLPAQLRRRLEDEFRNSSGILRVLVATDTLAQGVNLPADTVINCGLAAYGSDRLLTLVSAAELDNKAGRAGRRGLAARERGEFYILVPSERDLQEVQNLTATSVKTFASIAGVFERFVTGRDRTLRVIGRIRSLDDVALLTLHVLCSDGFGRRMESLEGRVQNVIANLLAAQSEEDDLPSAQLVIERLRELKLISGESDGKLRLSRVGEALARSALSLQSAYVLEQLARIAVQGAGDVDILFNACRSAEIDGVTAWIGLPSVPSRHYPSLKENILTYATAYCADNIQRRRDCAQYFAQERHPLPVDLVEEGQMVVSRELKEMLERDVELIDDKDATALLRALVSFEWSRGVPFDQMRARFSSAISSDEEQRGKARVEIKIHYSDVEQLCEQIAGVVRGSSAISFSESHDWSARIASLALRVEVGLPTWLAPIARIRNPLLHRSRLAKLWNVTPQVEHLSAVLDQPALKASRGISDVQREELRELLDRRELEDAQYRHRVAQEWASELVPGLLGSTFEDFGQEMEAAADGPTYSRLLAELAEGLSIEPSNSEVSAGFTGLWWRFGAEVIHFIIPDGELGAEEIDSVADKDCVVLIRRRLRTSGSVVLSQRPTVARFIRPEVLLEVIAKLAQARGEGLDGGEVMQRLRALKVSVLDAEDLVLSVDPPAAPPPFLGAAPSVPTRVDPHLPVDEGDAV
ncbi:SIR2 family protein [Kribbella sp. NPDC051587]|uniref:SIR2 family protein n=1 Tax=Kribbella sp. NPDC051587 TaxID=3364119 RepID=UPI00378BBAD5